MADRACRVLNGEDLMKKLLWLIPIVLAVCFWLYEPAVTHGPGVIAPDQPVQTGLSDA